MVGLEGDGGTANGDHGEVGYAPSGEAQKTRLLCTHRQAPTGGPGMDIIKPTLKTGLSLLDSGSGAKERNVVGIEECMGAW